VAAISPDLSNGPGPGNLTYGTITSIAVSPANSDIVYAGTDDGNVWVSMDDGGTWNLISNELPDRWVTRVAADNVEENTVYVTFSGYRYDEFLPHIFRSEDSGQTWEDVSGDLPEAPINDIIIDPDTNTTLYVASDFGVFSSRDLGQSWDMLGENLPLVPVCDIDLHQPTRKLIAATYGRSMYTYDLNQDTIVTSIHTNQHFPLDFSASIYPNPVSESGIVEINCDKEIVGKIEFFELSGKKIFTLFKGKLERGCNQFGFLKSNLGQSENITGNMVICRITSSSGKTSLKVLIN